MDNPKQYYLVKLTAIVETELAYKVYASSPDEALEIVVKTPGANLASAPRIKWDKLKKLKTKIYRFGSSVLELTKNF